MCRRSSNLLPVAVAADAPVYRLRMPTRSPQPGPSRRDFLGALSASSLAIAAREQSPVGRMNPSSRLLRIRTLTAGVPLTTLDDLAPVRAALDGLTRARDRCVAAGYEVQTIRIALPPLIAAMTTEARWMRMSYVVSGRASNSTIS